MTYDAQETSEYDAFAVELYQFTGSISSFKLTSYAVDYTYLLETYTSTPGLTRKSIKKTSSGGSQIGELEVQIPFNHPLAQEYAFSDVPPNLEMTLLRGHASDVDEAFVPLWKGAVTSWSVDKRTAKLRIPSAFSLALQNTIPSRRWQGPCNHLLYDAQCSVNRLLHDHATTIATFSGNSLTVADIPWVGTEGNGGEIINNRTGERRSIQSHSGTTLTLKLPFSDAIIGDPVVLYEGCDHLASTCANKFNNLDNFGGFNLVPNRNPFTQRQLR